MKKNITIAVLALTIIICGVYILSQKDSSFDNQTLETVNLTASTSETTSSVEKKVIAPIIEISDAKETIYTQIKGVTFVVPAGMTKVNDSEFYARNDGGRGASFRSSNYVTHIVNAGMGNTPSEGIKNGAVFSVGFEPENLHASIQSAKAFAEFQNEGSQNSSNLIKGEIITLDGIPAYYAIYKGSEGAIGGLIRVGMYKDDEIFSVGLKYGADETYESYESQFLATLESIDFK